jgi:hypothetical protein
MATFKRMSLLQLLSWLSVGMGVLNAAHAQQCTAPPADQIYWLGADDDFDDRAGFYNGSVGGQVDFVAGKVGRAVRFDDDADLVTPSVDASEMRAVRNNFTYELWAKPAAATSACPESSNGNCSGNEHRIAIFPQHGDTSAPPQELGVAAGIGLVIATNAVCVMAHTGFHLPCLLRHDAAISNSEFTHIAVVVENKRPRLYLNGVLVRTGQTSPKDFVFASWNIVGSGLGLGKYRGDLDEVSLYGRVLSDAEILASFNAGTFGKCKPACAPIGAGARDDFWDAQQGGIVTANSPMHTSGGPEDSFAIDALGAATPASVESGNAIFRDLLPDGSVHFLEWRTAEPMTLRGFRLHAAHDTAPQQRAFRSFRLFARALGAPAFTQVYGSSTGIPYPLANDPGVPNQSNLKRCPRLRPFDAQEFRAEFVQDGSFPGGPRVIELDGFDFDRMFANGFE